RGWAIACLAQIGGETADRKLANIHANTSESRLVRTWAAAARIELADDPAKLAEKASLAAQFPALTRPVATALRGKLLDDDKAIPLEALLTLTGRIRQLQAQMAPVIAERGPEMLASVMLNAKEQDVRSQAAAYLA